MRERKDRYMLVSIHNFKKFLADSRSNKKIRLYFDIETLLYNKEEGRNHPSKYKNWVYSVAISYFDEEDQLCVLRLPNFYTLFDSITSVLIRKKNPTIELVAHNNNKYDNHFLRFQMLKHYPKMKVENVFLKQATKEGNSNALKLTEIEKELKADGVLLEKRIKSANNMEMIFFIKNIKFVTIDNFMKTGTSLKTLGEKLYKLNLVTEDELKTSFDYNKYDLEYDMTDQEMDQYCLKVFNHLDDNEFKYIDNDVILLARAVQHYSSIFPNFDYNKMTFTSNILETYNDNDITNFQLLNKFEMDGKKGHLKYTDFQFGNENFYDYLKAYYSGGLNFYNQDYIGQIIEEPMFSIDENSAYPFAMHKELIPTFLIEYEEYEKETWITLDKQKDHYQLFRMSREAFDTVLLELTNSKVIRRMLVKYYGSKNDFININSKTIELIEILTKQTITKIPVFNYLTYECIPFGSRHTIEHYYYVKTQGKLNKKIIYNSPYNITVTDEVNENTFSPEEIDNSKVHLNGIYGVPALRAAFNLFRLVEKQYRNVANGYLNTERNLLFSVFVTSVSLFNLLKPLQYLTDQEIDENLMYTDTDSLYLNKKIKHKLPESLFDPIALGKWDIEKENIRNFFILNHKKYAFEYFDKKEQKYKIIAKAGGIPNESFDYNMSFEKFIRTQFNDGLTVINTKSIYNEQGTISIYESETELSIGGGYPLYTNDERLLQMKKDIMEDIRNNEIEFHDVLYIETDIGAFSFSEIYPIKNDVRHKEPLFFLQIEHDEIKKSLLTNDE